MKRLNSCAIKMVARVWTCNIIFLDGIKLGKMISVHAIDHFFTFQKKNEERKGEDGYIM